MRYRGALHGHSSQTANDLAAVVKRRLLLTQHYMLKKFDVTLDAETNGEANQFHDESFRERMNDIDGVFNGLGASVRKDLKV